MRRIVAILAMLMVFLALAVPAFGTVHEQVAAYCSGGGHGAIDADGFLEPPGISDFTKKNFAQPVLSNGVVVMGPTGPVVTDHPAAKYPAGSSPILGLPDPVHPSTHCNAMR